MKKLILLLIIILAGSGYISAQFSEEDYLRACYLMDEGKYDESRAVLQQMLVGDPDNDTILYELAYCNYLDGKVDDAAKTLKKLYKRDTDARGVYNLYSIILDEKGKPEEARKVIEKGIGKFPDLGFLYHTMGMTYLRQNDFENALSWFYKGIQAAPSHPSDYEKAASILLAVNKHLPAFLMLDALFMLEPTSQRSIQGGQAIAVCLSDMITVSTDSVGNQHINIKLDGHNIATPTDFPAMSMTYMLALASCANDSTDMTTISGIARARGRALDFLKSYGEKYDIIEHMQKLRDAGHWDAFNYFQLCGYAPEETDKWAQANKDKINNLGAWMKENPYKPDGKRSTAGLFPADMINIAASLEGEPTQDLPDNQ